MEKLQTESGSRPHIGIFGLLRKRITEQTKNVEYRQGVSVSWAGNKIPRWPTSSFAWGIEALLYGFDMARALKDLLSELLLGDIGGEIPTYLRSDKSETSYRADSVYTVTNVKRLNGFARQ